MTATSSAEFANWCASMPKVELHLHLEGAIPHDVLLELIKKYEPHLPFPDARTLAERFNYRDFSHFCETWVWKNSFLRDYDDFAFISEAVARDLSAQNVRYAEIFFSPTDFAHQGLSAQEIAEAIRRGLDVVQEVEVTLVADLVRDTGPGRAERTLSEINEVRELGIVGIGIGGSEQCFPPGPFAPVFERARELGFRTTAHAGEVAGAESIWCALRTLGAERIGHGTRAVEDESLLAYLADRQIPVEACPMSNVRTGVVRTLEEHPIRAFWERGILVTVNSDDPKMFGNSLAEEYELLHTRLGFSRLEIQRLVVNAITASWLAKSRKADILDAFKLDRGWLTA